MSHEPQAPTAPAMDTSTLLESAPESAAAAASEPQRDPRPRPARRAAALSHDPDREGSVTPAASVTDSMTPARLRWARLRFAIVGPLLASPPEPGELAGRIEELAKKPWRHPTTDSDGPSRVSMWSLERTSSVVSGATPVPSGSI